MLFVLNRYVAFLGYIPITFFLLIPPAMTATVLIDPCGQYSHFPAALNSVSQVLLSALLVMRCYGMYQRKLWVVLITLPFALASIAVSLWLTSIAASNVVGGTFTGINDTTELDFWLPICSTSSTQEAMLSTGPDGNLHRSVEPVWLLSPFLFDAIVFALTIFKTHQINKIQKTAGMQSELATLLMRDGSLYFAVMAAVNLFNFLIIVKYSPNNGGISGNPLEPSTQDMGSNSILGNALSVTMVSRLVLNLRAAGEPNAADGTCSTWIAQDIATFASPSAMLSDYYAAPEGEDVGECGDIHLTFSPDAKGFSEPCLEQLDRHMQLEPRA